MPIPLFRFPYLCLQKILRSMDLLEVLRLSTINKTIKRVLDFCEYPIDEWHWSDTDTIFLKIRNDMIICRILPEKVFSTESDVYSVNLDDESIVLRTEKLASDEKYAFVVESATEIRKTEEAKLRLNELFSRHCLSFIKPKSFQFTWMKARIRPDNLFMFELTKTFSLVLMNPLTAIISVSSDTLKMLMEEITAKEMYLTIRCSTENFRYQNTNNKSSKIKNLLLQKSDFLLFDNFIKHLNLPQLSCPVPSTTSINAILKEWIGGENHFVEYLELLNEEAVDLNREEVLAGLPHRETRLKSNQFNSLTEQKYIFQSFMLMFFGEGHEPMRAYDVKRDRDGREATIVFSRKKVTLHVWTDEHMEKIRNIHD